jgi:hypothetical protein
MLGTAVTDIGENTNAQEFRLGWLQQITDTVSRANRDVSMLDYLCKVSE